MSESKTKIQFIGGNNADRIGANAHIIEHENEKGETSCILFDFGSMFPPCEYFGKHFIPNIIHRFLYAPGKKHTNQIFKSYYTKQLYKKNDSIRNRNKLIQAIFLTHMHEDHIGGIIDMLKAGFVLPTIYGSKETLSVLAHLLIAEGVPEIPEMKPITGPVKISEDITITPFPVSHTVVGALGYHTLTKYKGENHIGIINLGDFNLSAIPLGEGYNKEKFNQFLKDKFITHVLTDSTSITNKNKEQLSFEDAIYNYSSIMRENKKRIISAVISRSTQNLVSILKAAKKTNRHVFIDGKQQRIIYEALANIGVLDEFKDTVHNHENTTKSNISDFTSKYPIEKQVVILSGAFAEGINFTDGAGISGLVKLARGTHQGLTLDNKSIILLSQRAIPVGTLVYDMQKMVGELAKKNAGQIIQNQTDESSALGNYPMVPLQRSGHASFYETVQILYYIKKNRLNNDDILTLIPIHGDEQQIKNSLSCAKMVNINSIQSKNGDEITLSTDGEILISHNHEAKQWIAFEGGIETPQGKNNGYGIELYEEEKINNKIIYKKIMSLGSAKRELIRAHEKENLIKLVSKMINRHIYE